MLKPLHSEAPPVRLFLLARSLSDCETTYRIVGPQTYDWPELSGHDLPVEAHLPSDIAYRWELGAKEVPYFIIRYTTSILRKQRLRRYNDPRLILKDPTLGDHLAKPAPALAVKWSSFEQSVLDLAAKQPRVPHRDCQANVVMSDATWRSVQEALLIGQARALPRRKVRSIKSAPSSQKTKAK